ncbi:MAG: DUF3391 domain-containing protein [Nitrospirae bacterium]|nr:DUF3391 domain-containing protein [Nitrospirota bacterium]
MIKKLKVEQLQAGMYIDGMDQPWIKTPFLTHHFMLKKASQLEQIKGAGIRYVLIDTEKSIQHAADTPQEKKDTPTQPVEKTPRYGTPYTKEELKRYCAAINQLTQIEKQTLLKGTAIDFPLFLKTDMSIQCIAEYKGKNIEITDNIIHRTGDFLIDKINNDRYKRYLNSILSSNLPIAKAIPLYNIVIRENSKILMQEIIDNPRSGKKIKSCKSLVEQITGSIQQNGQIVSGLLTLNKYDYYTYTHSVNVCVLCLGLAIALGGFAQKDINDLGMGSILHDVGKSQIPAEILNKPRKLSDREFTIMKQHVINGIRILSEEKDFPKNALYPIVEHHERLTGGGYPRGIRSADIHTIGRITSLVDTYDALTTARPYKRALTPFEALTIMERQIENYDRDIFRKFIKMLGSIEQDEK